MIHLHQSLVFGTSTNIAVIGCGGTGSHVLTGLARLAKTINMLNEEQGARRQIKVTAFDPDNVSESNTARQCFFDCDIGDNKATTLIHRINMAYGFSWKAQNAKFDGKLSFIPDILISCVDNSNARRTIHKYVNKWKVPYMIDCGNDQHYSQVLLGSTRHKELPLPYDEYPDLINSKQRDTGPSCSTEEALRKQDLMINQITALHAVQTIWEMLRTGAVTKRGHFINLATGMTSSIKA